MFQLVRIHNNNPILGEPTCSKNWCKLCEMSWLRQNGFDGRSSIICLPTPRDPDRDPLRAHSSHCATPCASLVTVPFATVPLCRVPMYHCAIVPLCRVHLQVCYCAICLSRPALFVFCSHMRWQRSIQFQLRFIEAKLNMAGLFFALFIHTWVVWVTLMIL